MISSWNGQLVIKREQERARSTARSPRREARPLCLVPKDQKSSSFLLFQGTSSSYEAFFDPSTVLITMDAQRLLGMLNGGSSAAATSSTSPSPAQHSPRMSSPPATLQSLLSQLQSPQPPSPREPPPHMMSPPISDAGNAAELFRSAGMLPNIPPPPPSHPGAVPGPNHHRVLSPSAGNAQSLLATLMSG